MGVQIGDEKTFRGTLTKNGTAWLVPVASATFLFVRPDGTSFTENATIVDATAVIVSYTTINGTDYQINQIGLWQIFVTTIDVNGKQLTMESPHTFDVKGTE
jgi:hypothetical protein